ISNYAFHNQKDLTFDDKTDEWGLNIPSFSNGCAYADLDNDGDLDLVVNNANMEAFVFKNNAETLYDNHYIKMKFEGSEQNKFGIGTSVRVYAGGQILLQELMPSRGFQSSIDYVMTLGLGKTETIDSIRVLWSDDKTQLLTNIQADQQLLIKHSEASDQYRYPKKEIGATYLTELSNNNMQLHEENLFNDFDQEGLISKKLSQEGPAMATVDVDGDGDEDVYIGGAKGQSGQLYLHQGNGKLTAVPQKSFDDDAYFEDVAALFVDVDGDEDADLIVGNGGNESIDQKYYGVRLYLNDGKGSFTRSENDLPSVRHNVSVITATDVESDGDMDLFIGSRSVPSIYGIDPQHQLLLNDGGGNFADVTERMAYDTRNAGMVTDAMWTDINGDGRDDLITVADWGVPQVFVASRRGRLSKFASSLDSLTGWWNTVAATDLDNDGDMDLVLGNMGSNIPYKASQTKPLRLWVNDFDDNGTIEQITTWADGEKDLPIYMKKEITGQIVSLRKENLKASEYAVKSIDQLFSADVLQNTIVKEVANSQSVIAVNLGNGQFQIRPLPARVQLSCVNSIALTDVNADGHTDLITAGNNFEFKPQYSRLDACYGDVLIGDGKLGFEWQQYDKTGLFIRDEVKHLGQFSDKDGRKFLIAAINDQKPRVYKMNQVETDD
ncbi:MAG: FG-GAP-like repeat-containing protein, partial [Bacteroidota bacterium]